MSHPPKGARLSERIRVFIAQHLPTLQDPLVVDDAGLSMVTVTQVRMGADNERATVYWTVFPDGPHERTRTAKGLKRATGLLRRDLGRVLHVRKVPELIFEHDDVAQSGRSIEHILDEIKQRELAMPKGEPQVTEEFGDTSSDITADEQALPDAAQDGGQPMLAEDADAQEA